MFHTNHYNMILSIADVKPNDLILVTWTGSLQSLAIIKVNPDINNLSNITSEDISILQNNQAPIEFIDPNETLYTLIASNINVLTNPTNSN